MSQYMVGVPWTVEKIRRWNVSEYLHAKLERSPDFLGYPRVCWNVPTVEREAAI